MRDGPNRSTNSNEENRTVKRTVAIVASLAALGVVAYVGSRLWAQGPAGAGAAAHSRVAVVNLLQVIKNYNKAKFYETELEETLKPFRTQAEKMKGDLLKWQNFLADPKNNVTQEQKDQGEKSITTLKRQLEDLDKEARKAFGKKRETQVVQLYKEIDEVVKAYAPSQGFQLVLAYGEPVSSGDMFSAPNIARKLEGIQMGGACMPMFVHGSLDITSAVVDTLNRAYPGGTPAAAAPATKPAATTRK
jgi:Skp family chaperone for outer membrane proteins